MPPRISRGPPPLEAEKKSECAKNGKNASIEVSPEALGRVLRAHLMPAHPPTQRLGRFRVLILSFLRSGLRSEPRPLEAEKKSECAKNGKNASIEVSPEALGRVLRAHLMPAHPPTQRLGRFRVLILSFLGSGFRSHVYRARKAPPRASERSPQPPAYRLLLVFAVCATRVGSTAAPAAGLPRGGATELSTRRAMT